MFVMELKNKKVLLVGLGILGGGVATAKWLVKNEAKLTITDLKDEEYLKSSISKLKKLNIEYVLGKHRKGDFKKSDLIVLNPDVPVDSPFIKIAQENNIPITNELNLFVEYCKSKNVIAITGTRGKTTVTQWTAFLMNKILGNTHVVGNSPQAPFLGMIDKIKKDDYVVLETPSYHLEIINKDFQPKVSVITNIYRDHINRHKTEKNYAKIKSNIFKYQSEDDFVILNKEDKWTKSFLRSKKIKPKIIFFNNKKLPKTSKDFGGHNKKNLQIAISVLEIFGADTSLVKKYINKLPQPIFRQEKVYKDNNLLVINDSAATSPEATVAAVKRFKSPQLILITGGTDKGLKYNELGKFLNKNISNKNLILLSGSATEKLKKHLTFKNLNEFNSLKECLEYAKSLDKKMLVFSPGSKSFEKFKNEFDRGVQFNRLFGKVFGCKV